MYSSSNKPDYRYKPPSKSANVSGYESNRSRNFDEICDETWPLDEVIDKIDIKSDSEDEYNYNRNIQTWRSGPQLILETSNSGREQKRIPGEGALYSSFTEGTKFWKDKSVRHHEYNSKRGSQFDLSSRYTKPTSSYDPNNNFLNEFSDRSEYLVSPIPQHREYDDEDDSPSLRDVGIQCNLRRYETEKQLRVVDHLVSQKPPIRVIKSQDTGFVSTYSDVPRLQSPMRSIETRHKIIDDSDDLPVGSDAIYSQVNKSAKTRNGNNNINIIYKQPMNESLTSQRSILNDSRQYDTRTKETGFSISNAAAPKINLANPLDTSQTKSNADLRDRSNEKEIIEETISLSNTSSEDYFAPAKQSQLPSREVDKRKQSQNRYNDNLSFTGNSITSKSSSTYRRNSPARYDRAGKSGNVYGTIEKAKGKSKKKRAPNDENVLLANNSLRLKSSKLLDIDRLYKSNADLRDQYHRDETRGGLAAAYKNRQHNSNSSKHRALSLNRMNASTPTRDEDSHLSHCQVPSRHLSHTQLNSSRCSDSGSGSYPHHQRSSRTSMQHERDPIVMYIPTVSHQRANTSTAESPKLTSILRHNSTKSTATLPSKGKKVKEAKSQTKSNLKEKEKEKQSKSDKKKDLNRRHSMPKDTKFNWFSKFKLSKSSK